MGPRPSVINVREATEADAAAIALAHTLAWQAAYRGIVPDSFLDSIDVSDRTNSWAAILRGEVSVPGVARPIDFVAEADGTVVGFADVGEYRDSPDPRAGELWAMYVAPEFWGTGVGEALMNSTLEQLAKDNRSRAYLWVLHDNARARRFYERHGWIGDKSTKQFEIADVSVVEMRYSRRIA
jgi:GNAT superfamily N-acetyltransferase